MRFYEILADFMNFIRCGRPALGTLGANLLGNILSGTERNRAEEVIVRVGYGNKKGQKAIKKRQYEKK